MIFQLIPTGLDLNFSESSKTSEARSYIGETDYSALTLSIHFYDIWAKASEVFDDSENLGQIQLESIENSQIAMADDFLWLLKVGSFGVV